MKAFPLSVAFVSLAYSCANAGVDRRAPGDVELPAIEQRQVVGTWYDKDTRCTRSFERVKGKVFKGLRCSDGSGGGSGSELTVLSSTKFRPKPAKPSGDYYLIAPDGALGIYDSDGLVDRLPKHPTLRP